MSTLVGAIAADPENTCLVGCIEQKIHQRSDTLVLAKQVGGTAGFFYDMRGLES